MNKYPYPALSRDCCGEDCHYLGAEIGFVLSDLPARQLWPKYKCLREHTLYSVTRELLHFEGFNQKHCDRRPSSLQAAFYRAAVFPEESRGLCLACVKRGKYSAKSGNYQASFIPDCEILESLKRKRGISPYPYSRLIWHCSWWGEKTGFPQKQWRLAVAGARDPKKSLDG